MKCTIQNIADHLGLSRNTVSKALKNSSEVSENTRNLVIKMPLSPPLSYLPPKQAAMGRFFSLPELTLPTPNFGPPFYEELNRFFQMRIIIWQSVSCPTVI